MCIATWDSPPRPEEFGYEDFKAAYEDFLYARTVQVKKKTASEIQKIDNRGGRRRWDREILGIPEVENPETATYDIGQDPANKLLPFQVSEIQRIQVTEGAG